MALLRILALDLSQTGTGFAVNRESGPPILGTKAFPSCQGGSQLGTVYVAFDDWLDDLISVHQPHQVWYEAPNETGNRPTWMAQLLFGITAYAEGRAARRGLPVFMEHVSTIRKFVLGQGSPTKKDPRDGKTLAKAYCEQRGWDYQGDSNRADAAVLLVYAGACGGLKI